MHICTCFQTEIRIGVRYGRIWTRYSSTRIWRNRRNSQAKYSFRSLFTWSWGFKETFQKKILEWCIYIFFGESSLQLLQRDSSTDMQARGHGTHTSVRINYFLFFLPSWAVVSYLSFFRQEGHAPRPIYPFFTLSIFVLGSPLLVQIAQFLPLRTANPIHHLQRWVCRSTISKPEQQRKP